MGLSLDALEGYGDFQVHVDSIKCMHGDWL